MKQWLENDLICPECLPFQTPLTLDVYEKSQADILEGTLSCPRCESQYPIHDGLAVIVPQKTLALTQDTSGYNSASMRSSYLWSHYSEFFNGPDATDAYQKWASCFTREEGLALDIGCSVGRLSFELSKTHTRVVGVDTSVSFIREARKILAEQRLEFDLIIEGEIAEKRSSDLDPAYRYNAVEFIVADAMALPFRSERFTTAASVNILEKVPDPAGHLKETNRILDRNHAHFLFSDPFSWDEAVSHPDLWLGGRNSGPYQGRGMDNLCRLVQGEGDVLTPGFSIRQKGDLLWKIRKTANLWEHITSQFIIATRDA